MDIQIAALMTDMQQKKADLEQLREYANDTSGSLVVNVSIQTSTLQTVGVELRTLYNKAE